MSLDVKDLTGGFIIEDCEDVLEGCNKGGIIEELPLAWSLAVCCIDGGGGNAIDPILPSAELFALPSTCVWKDMFWLF